MRIKPSKQTMLVMAVIAVMLFGVCGFTYYNRASRLSVLEHDIKKKEARLADSEKIARQLADVECQYQQAQTNLGVLEKGVSTKAYVPTLLRQVETLGRSMNLRVLGVKPQTIVEPPPPVQAKPEGESGKNGDKAAVAVPVKKPDPYEKLSIDLQVSGKYWDVVKFVETITQFPKIIAVNSMQITPLDSTAKSLGSPELSVRLNATAFILKEPVANKKTSDTREAVVNSPRS